MAGMATRREVSPAEAFVLCSMLPGSLRACIHCNQQAHLNCTFILLCMLGSLCKTACARVQAAAGMGIYGPRTVYCIALKDAPGCHEFLLQDDGKWLHVKETTEIGARWGVCMLAQVVPVRRAGGEFSPGAHAGHCWHTYACDATDPTL